MAQTPIKEGFNCRLIPPYLMQGMGNTFMRPVTRVVQLLWFKGLTFPIIISLLKQKTKKTSLSYI